VILSLGFGAFLITTLYLVQSNLLRRFEFNAAASQANLVFFDIQDDQLEGVDSIVSTKGRIVQSAPIVTMRISRINDRPVEKIVADSRARRRSDSLARARGGAAAESVQRRNADEADARKKGAPRGQSGRAGWALNREYRSTYRDTLTSGEKITSGKWFSRTALEGLSDTTEMSLEVDVAEELRVKLGDVITWNVQGVEIPTRITSLREVDWAQFSPNFFAVLEPRALSSAPAQYVLLARVPGDSAVQRLQHDVVVSWPNISSIDLSLVQRTIEGVIRQVSTAVRFLGLFSVAMGIPVLFSAVAATRRARMREGVLLKTLGATRRQVRMVLIAEYTALGVLGALTGLVLSFGAAWGLAHYALEVTYIPAVAPAAVILAGMLVLVLSIGLLAGREVYSGTPMDALREG
jgi:putative ABC transport system permease protein